ncbi:MAG: PorP/SprF family type IX secretion system membrane protein [Crocinitomicaceae bacterium]|nr:PorP/SprF family type IX secretion system membrane protein [Crocinitomicaceae bacterium]
MKFKLTFISCICLFSLGFNSKAQDFHLSMYDAAPLFLNPALTGVVEGSWRIHGQYRTQWKAVNFKPYQTALISFDAPYKKWGFGGQVVNYRAGIGNYNVLQGIGSAAYTLSLDKKEANIISFGIQGGLTQKYVEHQLHTFDNQYSSSNGGSFDNSLDNGESFGGQSFVIPELNAGILYYHAKQQSRINPFIGVSIFNLLRPNESWYGVTNKLPIRYYAHLGTRINITESLYLIPKALYMRQENFSEFTLATDLGIYLKKNELYILGGLIYRAADAAVLSIGLKKDGYVTKLAYDFNLSTLTAASTGRGGFELSFTYMHQKKDKQTVKICPRL